MNDSAALTAGLLAVFIDVLRVLDRKGVLPKEELYAALTESLAAGPDGEINHPKHAVLRFLVEGLDPGPKSPTPPRRDHLRVIEGGNAE